MRTMNGIGALGDSALDACQMVRCRAIACQMSSVMLAAAPAENKGPLDIATGTEVLVGSTDKLDVNVSPRSALVVALLVTATVDVPAQESPKAWVTGAAVVSLHNPGESDDYVTGASGGAARRGRGDTGANTSLLRAGHQFCYDAVIEGENRDEPGRWVDRPRSSNGTRRDRTFCVVGTRGHAPLTDIRWGTQAGVSTYGAPPRRMWR